MSEENKLEFDNEIPTLKKANKKNQKEKIINTSSDEIKYKLNLYTDRGTIKSSFNGAVLLDVSKNYGDIMRSVSSTRYMNMDEICEAVWTVERKMRHPGNRTRLQIETAISELVKRNMIVTS